MPVFQPLVRPTPLPAVGNAIERAVMDWKVKPAQYPFEKAKDVAAFANHLGGCILIGAQEIDGQLAAYVGLTPAETDDVRDDYSKAVAQRCQPPPQVDFEEYPDPTNAAKRVVAINVWPSLNLIGVKIEAHKPTEGYGGPSYVYPVRSGTDATYLQPVQLPMHMTPQIRRIVVMLSRIPARSKVQLIEARLDGSKIENAFFFDGLAEEENLIRFLTLGAEPSPLHVPLDRILTVYQGQDSWRVVSQFFR